MLSRIGFVSEYKEEGVKESAKSYRKQSHNLWIKYNHEVIHNEFIRDVGLDHIAFSAESECEIDELYKLVKTFDVKITREPKHYPEYTDKYYAFYFRTSGRESSPF